MSINRWKDWLNAQKHWASLVHGGYKHHTPESVYLVCHRQLDSALDWTNRVNDRRAR